MTIEDQKVTVVGKVDPAKIREKVEQKTHKKVELISPKLPKKDGDSKENGKGKENDGGADTGKKEKKNESKDKNSNDKKSDQKTSKEKEVLIN